MRTVDTGAMQKYTFMLAHPNGESVVLAAETEREMHEWMQAVRTSRMCITDADAAMQNETQRRTSAEQQLEGALGKGGDGDSALLSIEKELEAVQGEHKEVRLPGHLTRRPPVSLQCARLRADERGAGNRCAWVGPMVSSRVCACVRWPWQVEVEKEKAEKELKELMARFKLRKALLHWRHRKLTLSFRTLIRTVRAAAASVTRRSLPTRHARVQAISLPCCTVFPSPLAPLTPDSRPSVPRRAGLRGADQPGGQQEGVGRRAARGDAGGARQGRRRAGEGRGRQAPFRGDAHKGPSRPPPLSDATGR